MPETRLKYERIIPSLPDNIAFCRRAMKKGMAIANGASVPLNSPPEWFNHQGRGRSFLFHLHSWDPLESLFIAYDQEATPEIFNILIRIISDWCRTFTALNIDKQLAEHGLEEDLIWYDMAVGMRTYRLAYLMDCLYNATGSLIGSAQRNELLSLFQNSLSLHRDYLANDNNFRANNHGMYQSFAQMATGRRLDRYDFQVQEKCGSRERSVLKCCSGRNSPRRGYMSSIPPITIGLYI